MAKQKFTNRNGVTFVTTDRMYPMAIAALNTLKEQTVKGISIHKVNFKRFPCGEMKPKITENVRHKDIFLFFDFNGQPNDDVVNLMLTIDALHLADAKRITLVLPYMPYLRQDRKDEPRTPVSAAWFIRALQLCRSVSRVITIDMHSEQLQAVFTIPTDHLPGRMLFAPWAKKQFNGNFENLVAVAPDFGSAKRVRKLAADIDSTVQVAILEKNRDAEGVKMYSIIGASIKGKTCLINDDMMDTCGTIILAAMTLFEHGANKVVLSATHPIFSPTQEFVIDEETGEKIIDEETAEPIMKTSTAYDKLAEAGVEVLVSDSLVTEKYDWLEVLPLGELIGLTILQNITSDGSVSKLIRQGLPDL
tara:strand:- start:703 stop:1788 length:1086 start_codon:yes stop_codon:yes gene_type:complete